MHPTLTHFESLHMHEAFFSFSVLSTTDVTGFMIIISELFLLTLKPAPDVFDALQYVYISFIDW